MARYVNSKDKKVRKIIVKELEEFNQIIDGHMQILTAIGKL